MLHGFERAKGINQRINRLLFEENAGVSSGVCDFAGKHAEDTLERSAARVGDDRAAGGLCFDWREANVFFAREEKGSAAAIVRANDFVGLKAQERNSRAGELAERGGLFALADDDESRAELIAGANREINSFVLYERTDYQVEVRCGIADGKITDIDWGIDDLRAAAVIFMNSPGGIPRTSGEMVHTS